VDNYKTVYTNQLDMTEVSEVYLCELCGNKVKVVESGAGTLVCCGEDMVKVE
jgi:desulfoferrodoxin-like iron-binding protein